MTQEIGLDATPVLRLDRLEEVTLGEVDFEREILDCLIADVADGILRLREAIRGPEPAGAAALLHGIVGTCRTLGADALAEASRTLELQAVNPGFTPGPGWLDPVDREFARLRDAVAARLGS